MLKGQITTGLGSAPIRRGTLSLQTSKQRKQKTISIDFRNLSQANASQLFSEQILSKEDDFRELDRRFRRTVYDHQEWKSHRSLFRYVRSIAHIHRSSILRAIAVPVAFTTVFATLVCTYNAAIAKGIIKATLPQLVIPQALINLPSFCLSLLLVFRTNASYGRFDEARKMWGLMLNRSRDLTRQAVTYFPPHAIAAKRMLARWTIAMQKSLLDVCRGDCDYKAFMGDTLRKEEMERIEKSPHKVVYSLQMMSEVITAMHVHPQWTVDMMCNLTTFHDILGGCERLIRTPIPLHYTRFTSRFLLFWLALLPMGMWGTIGWATIPATFVMAVLLLGIEEIGVSIEDPFGILALEIIQKRAETDVMSQIESCKDSYEYVQEQLIRGGALAEQGPAFVYMQGQTEASGKYGSVVEEVRSNGSAAGKVVATSVNKSENGTNGNGSSQ